MKNGRLFPQKFSPVHYYLLFRLDKKNNSDNNFNNLSHQVYVCLFCKSFLSLIIFFSFGYTSTTLNLIADLENADSIKKRLCKQIGGIWYCEYVQTALQIFYLAFWFSFSFSGFNVNI